MSNSSRLPDSARHVLLLLNPKAGARSGLATLERLRELLLERRFLVETLSDIRGLVDRVHELSDSRELRCIVAAGGDGTVSLIADRTPPGTPIAVFPLGTENLLAKYCQLNCDPAAICQLIVDGHTQVFDAGRAGERVFLLMLGCGFDADVVRRLHRERTGHIHHLSYIKPIFESMCAYDYPELHLHCEIAAHTGEMATRQESITARWAFVINLPRYAGGLRIAPQASGDDGLLDVCTFKAGSLWNGLRYLSGVLMGQHESWDDCVTLRARRIRIESAAPAPFQIDGDPGGDLPIDIEVLPRRLTLLTRSDTKLAE